VRLHPALHDGGAAVLGHTAFASTVGELSLVSDGARCHAISMNKSDLTMGEQNAIQRVSAGSEVGNDMWQDLTRKGLVERRQGKRALTEKGRNALALLR
jgi:hypothetical protein